MRRAAFVLIIFLGMALVVGGLMIESLLIMQRVATVSNIQGDVMVRSRNAEAFMPLGDAPRVVAGDVVRTGSDGALTLSWIDKSRIRVGPDTTLEVLKCQVNRARNSEAYMFRLDVGKVWVRVVKALSQSSTFEISTPTATAAVRGTLFSVEVDPAGLTRVAVLDGRVDLVADGQAVAVDRRQEARAGSAGATVTVTALQDEAGWEQAAEISAPWLVISEPAAARLPAGAVEVTVRGEAERGARVTVNGEPVEFNLGSRFQAQVPVPAGNEPVEIVVRAEDSRGMATVETLTLER